MDGYINKKNYTETRFSRVHRAATAEPILIKFCTSGGLSDTIEAASKLVQGFGRGSGAKFRLSHWLYHWLLTLHMLRYRACAW